MKKSLAIAGCLIFFSTSATALDFGIGAKAGLNGIGLDLTVGLTRNINLRVAASSIDIEGEEETVTVGDTVEGDIDAELDLDFGANAIMIDWHVLGGGFRLSAGMFRHTGVFPALSRHRLGPWRGRRRRVVAVGGFRGRDSRSVSQFGG